MNTSIVGLEDPRPTGHGVTSSSRPETKFVHTWIHLRNCINEVFGLTGNYSPTHWHHQVLISTLYKCIHTSNTSGLREIKGKIVGGGNGGRRVERGWEGMLDSGQRKEEVLTDFRVHVKVLVVCIWSITKYMNHYVCAGRITVT